MKKYLVEKDRGQGKTTTALYEYKKENCLFFCTNFPTKSTLQYRLDSKEEKNIQPFYCVSHITFDFGMSCSDIERIIIDNIDITMSICVL